MIKIITTFDDKMSYERSAPNMIMGHRFAKDQLVTGVEMEWEGRMRFYPPHRIYQIEVFEDDGQASDPPKREGASRKAAVTRTVGKRKRAPKRDTGTDKND